MRPSHETQARRVRVATTLTIRPVRRGKRRARAAEPQPLPHTLADWEALTPRERAARTGSDVHPTPYISSPRVKRTHHHRVHCGHCGHVFAPIHEVHVHGVSSFLCFECLERARDAHHRRGRADAMSLAVERSRKAR